MRLTNKETKIKLSDTKRYDLQDHKMFTKLSELEDIEERIGIDKIKNEINKGTITVDDQLKLVSPNIERIVSDATNRVVVVNFSDGYREVVRCQEGDTFDTYIGVAVALVRHYCGSNTRFRNLVDSLVVYPGGWKSKVGKKDAKDTKSAKEHIYRITIQEERRTL